MDITRGQPGTGADNRRLEPIAIEVTGGRGRGAGPARPRFRVTQQSTVSYAIGVEAHVPLDAGKPGEVSGNRHRTIKKLRPESLEGHSI